MVILYIEIKVAAVHFYLHESTRDQDVTSHFTHPGRYPTKPARLILALKIVRIAIEIQSYSLCRSGTQRHVYRIQKNRRGSDETIDLYY